MLEIRTNNKLREEKHWIVSTLIGEFLGLDFNLIFDSELHNRTSINHRGNSLVINDEFFSMNKDEWLKESSLPNRPLRQWYVVKDIPDANLVSPDLPVLFGDGKFSVDEKSNAMLELDVFGSAFFMMTRYEEVVLQSRDKFGRFPAAASISVLEGFIERPIINEYLEVLWSCMKTIWPKLRRRERKYTEVITCDVDRPYQLGTKDLVKQIKTIGADFVVRKNPVRAVQSLINYVAVKFGNYRFDPYLSRINWIANINNSVGKKVNFYFIATRSGNSLDGGYSIEEPIIRKVLRNISEGGHRIGLHPSLSTYDNAEMMLSERDQLMEVMDEEGLAQNLVDVRQHYLLWRADVTPQIHDAAGLHHDSSMGFAERCGFRAGVCYEYPFFSIVERRELNVRIRPLIVMETTLFGRSYMNLGKGSRALRYVKELQGVCKMFGGDFVLLWHNDSFEDINSRRLYKNIAGLK